MECVRLPLFDKVLYACVCAYVCTYVCAYVRTRSIVKRKKRVPNRGDELGSPHLRVCGRAWAYVCACAGGVQQGYKVVT